MTLPAAWRKTSCGRPSTAFSAKLPEEQRNLFLRRYWYLDSIADIARRFACSESKVKTTLLRCRKRLREHLEEGGYIL